MINKAAAFALKAHEGQVRKGSDIPYILHPMEVCAIVGRMTTDPEILAAALLHDTVEDCGVTLETIREEFGGRVADIVGAETEDKSRSWLERKGHTIETLPGKSRDVKLVTLGDKLSNIRSLSRDYAVLGESVWDRFNMKNKEKQGWYYKGLCGALSDLRRYAEYEEFCALVAKVFGE